MSFVEDVTKVVCKILPNDLQDKIVSFSKTPLYPPLVVRNMFDRLIFTSEEKKLLIDEIKYHEYRIKMLFKNMLNVTEIVDINNTIIYYSDYDNDGNRKRLKLHINPMVSGYMCSTMLHYLHNVHTLVLFDPQIFFDYLYVPKTLKTLVIKNNEYRRTLKFYLGSLKKEKVLYDNIDNLFIYRNDKLKYSIC